MRSPNNGLPLVRLGVDVLFDNRAQVLSGLRVGLITNHTGFDSTGTSTIHRFFRHDGIDLEALFSPEHGIDGIFDQKVGNAVHSETGIKVFSLYGDTCQPTVEMLAGIDALVFDIQDIGARFYTYITTLSYCMAAAGQQGIPFFVLDRPNPISGQQVEGPVLECELLSFVGPHEIALRPGMTVGELALMFSSEFGVRCNLTVVPMQGWRRRMYYDDTGLPFRPTSPAMPTIASAICYPGICLLERTNVSVGRGTVQPFQLFGAPWLDGNALAQLLNEAGLPGVTFEVTSFTPTAGARHCSGVPCHGVRVRVTDRITFRPVRAGLHALCGIRRLHPREFTISAGTDQLIGIRSVREAIERGEPAADIECLLHTGVSDFMTKRAKYLLYE